MKVSFLMFSISQCQKNIKSCDMGRLSKHKSKAFLGLFQANLRTHIFNFLAQKSTMVTFYGRCCAKMTTSMTYAFFSGNRIEYFVKKENWRMATDFHGGKINFFESTQTKSAEN